MGCIRQLSITITEDMPLNSAVYEPGRDKIYAVRSGRVFKFNSAGVKEAEARFLSPAMDDSYCAYDSTTDRIWAIMKRSFGSPSDASFPDKRLVSIHPDTLAVVNSYNFRNQITFGDNWTGALTGPQAILASGGIAFLLAYSEAAQLEITQMVRLDLTTSPPSETHTFGSVQGGGWGNILLDGTVVWFCSNDGFNSIDARTQATLAAHTDFVQLDGSADRPYGLTRNPGGAIYAVQGTQFILKGTPAAAPVLRTVIDLGRANATPFNIKYSAFDSRIYIPLFKDDTVAVLNPADDSFTIKTGFDSPFDVVVTNARAFAVQHSAQGLKEIV